jgi:guanylate kinase
MEIEGRHYHFIDQKQFQKMVDSGMLLEWANVFSNWYGTSISEIDRIRSLGKKVLLEIDVQGWHYARKKLPHAVAILILPPSVEELWKRLEKRGTDGFEVRWRRFLTARDEIKRASEYQFFIINDDLDRAFAELKSILIDGKPQLRLTQQTGLDHVEDLLEQFERSENIASFSQAP